jgi:GNAT superfamily N-acetyltransferase
VPPLCSAVLGKIHEQLARTVHLVRLLPPEQLQAVPIPGAWPPAILLGHILECLAGFCAVLAAASPDLLPHFAQLRGQPVNQPIDAAEALFRIAMYRTAIDEGFALLGDADLARALPTVFVPQGESILTLLLGNLEHLINHKHQLFTYLRLMDIPVGTPDLYCFRGFNLRPATSTDVPAIRALIDASVRGLQAADYSPAQIDQSLRSVYGVDTQLIADGTYYVVEWAGEIVGCGGWSRRKTLYGGDQFHGRQDSALDPAVDAAKIRAFFVHPDWTRRGIAAMVLEACEDAAAIAGFKRCEMGATLTGVAFYRAKGYATRETIQVPLEGADPLTVIRMDKPIAAR